MKIAYDYVLKRPGCVLLQAAMGCNPNIVHDFNYRSWLVAPTPDLKVYEVTDSQLAMLIAITDKENNNA